MFDGKYEQLDFDSRIHPGNFHMDTKNDGL